MGNAVAGGAKSLRVVVGMPTALLCNEAVSYNLNLSLSHLRKVPRCIWVKAALHRNCFCDLLAEHD